MTQVYRVLVVFLRRLPRRPLEVFLLTALRLNYILIPWNRKHLFNIFRRIQSFGGRQPSREELTRTLGQSLRHNVRFTLSMLCRPEDIEYARNSVDLEFLPMLEKILRQEKGAILACGSFGLFGHAVIALLLRNYRLTIPVLDSRFFLGAPEDWSDSFVTLGKASRISAQALQRNEIVVITTIYNFLPRAQPVEFFGSPANLTHAPARLSIDTGAPILPIFAIDEGSRCHVVCDRPLEVEGGPDAEVRTTEKLARIQEKYISSHPEQWEAFGNPWNLAS